ncbi:MAG: Holliday junction resolvase RuvX [Patescibacteria group bacterium]|nr:Holliday junction resolvase RuvX [Patescibacteria group bacterium]
MRENILGIDYGDKRIGLALAEVGSLALPYKVIGNRGRQDLLKQIKEIIKENNISRLVLGLPLSLSGKENERYRITVDFLAWLKDNFDLPVETVNEQFSSRLYQRQNVKKDIDKHAAAAILDSFLSKND